MGAPDGHPGDGVYPIVDDADPYGVGSTGPAVPAGSGLIAPRAGRSRSHDAVICVYDETGNVIETHEHAGDFKEP